MSGVPERRSPAPRGSESAARLLNLDFLGECGELLACFGAAICAAAGAGNLELTEAALRQARAALLEAIAAFRELQRGAGE